jgi:two-component system response regulator FlrC
MNPQSSQGDLPLALVVDDDVAVRKLIIALLNGSKCCEALEASDGLEAVQIYATQKRPVSLLVTDVQMPGMDGLALARYLVQVQPKLRVIYMSGSIEAQPNVVWGSKWIRKPFDCTSFLTDVRCFLPS